MSRHLAPTKANRAAAREMLPAYARRLIELHAAALQPLSEVSKTAGEASTALALDAIAASRNARDELAKAESDILGVLVLAGVARTTLARAVGQRPETLAARLLNTPAGWVQRELRRDDEALGGWAP